MAQNWECREIYIDRKGVKEDRKEWLFESYLELIFCINCKPNWKYDDAIYMQCVCRERGGALRMCNMLVESQ